MMTAFYIDLFPCCVLFLVLHDLHHNLVLTEKVRRCRNINFLICVVLLSDMAAWFCHGRIFPGSYPILWVANVVYFAISVVVAFQWFVAVHYILYGHDVYLRFRKYFIVASLPLLVYLILLAVHPDWIFRVTAENEYARGDYFFIQTVLGLAYMLASSVLALFHGVQEKVPSWRQEDFVLAGFIVFPLIGGVIQVINKNIILLWPFTVVSMFLFYLNLRQEQIQKDELTKLNNRRWLDESLKRKFEESVEGEAWYLFLIDLNELKTVNDTYGHTEGDVLLREVAQLLQRVFVADNSFVARYGGDEFAVVMNCAEGEALRYREKLFGEIERRNSETKKPYTLSLGIGGVPFEYGKYKDINELLIVADKKMYLHKEESKK